MMKWESLKACYAAVAVCMGIGYSGALPRIDVKPGRDFYCGKLCYDAPYCDAVPCLCDDSKCLGFNPADGVLACIATKTMWCAGSYEHGTVTVSEGHLDAIPHEMIHRLLMRSRLQADGDPGHEGPWWRCQHGIAECSGLRGWPSAVVQDREVVQ